MKQFICAKSTFILVSLCLSSVVFAQVKSLGLQLNFNQAYPINSSYTGSLLNVSPELSFKIHKSRAVNLGLDILILRRGIYNELNLTDDRGNSLGTYNLQSKFDYFALELKNGILRRGKVTTLFSYGIIPALRIQALTITPEIDGVQQQLETNLNGLVKQLDLGLLGEIETSTKISENLRASLLLTYRQSITDYTKSTSSSWHRGLSVAVGCNYVIGH